MACASILGQPPTIFLHFADSHTFADHNPVANFEQPFVPFETFGDPATLNCDRDSQGDVWFADMGVSVVRPRCLDELEQGLLPQKWMGRRIGPIESWGGCDVDYPWQIPGVEYWLLAHGVEPASLPERVV